MLLGGDCCGEGSVGSSAKWIFFALLFFIFWIFFCLLFSCLALRGDGIDDSKPGGNGISEREEVDGEDLLFLERGPKLFFKCSWALRLLEGDGICLCLSCGKWLIEAWAVNFW